MTTTITIIPMTAPIVESQEWVLNTKKREILIAQEYLSMNTTIQECQTAALSPNHKFLTPVARNAASGVSNNNNAQHHLTQ